MTDSETTQPLENDARQKITILWNDPNRGQEEITVDSYRISDGFLVLIVAKDHKRWINIVLIAEFFEDPAK